MPPTLSSRREPGALAHADGCDADDRRWIDVRGEVPPADRTARHRDHSAASRILPALGLVVSLSLLGCDGAVVGDPTPANPEASLSTASAQPPASGLSGVPSPSGSVGPSARAAAWLQAGDLQEARNATHAVPVGTGQILVVGSDWADCGASTDGSDSVEIGDPVTGVWETTTSLPSLRDDPVVVALPDGRGLMTGGAAGESIGWSAYSSTYVFDPGTRRWSRSGLLNTARTATAAAVLLDGRVLVAGGQYLDRASPEEARGLDSSEIWDPRSGAWSRTGRLEGARVGPSAVTLADGRVLLVGGSASLDDDQVQQVSTETYDAETGEWNPAGRLATARSEFSLVALADGGALVAGGRGGTGPTGYERLSTVERFDPISNDWTPADDLPVSVAGASIVRLVDGLVLLAGGSVRDPKLTGDDATTFISGLTADARLFDPEAGTWTATTPMPSPRTGASAVLMADGSAVVAGGSASEGNPGDTPSCPEADPQVLRYVPGS